MESPVKLIEKICSERWEEQQEAQYGHRIPEKKLVSGILDRALRDLNDPERYIRRAAASWFRCESKKEFSFLWCCDILDLDSDRALRFLKAHIFENVKKYPDIRF